MLQLLALFLMFFTANDAPPPEGAGQAGGGEGDGTGN